MKKLILAAAVAGAVLLSSAAQAQTTPEGYQLQQVLMMSRHNLRAPLANNGSVLEQSTPNQWPEWDVPGGQLSHRQCSRKLNINYSEHITHCTC